MNFLCIPPIHYVLPPLLLLPLIISLISAFRNRHYNIPSPPLPLFKRFTIGHNLISLVLLQDPVSTANKFNEWRRTYGSVFQLYSLFGDPCVFVTSANGIRDVHIVNQSSFVKADSSRNFISSIVGAHGILLAEGERHARLRRAVAPALHFDALKRVGEVFIEQGRRMAERLDGDVDMLYETRRAAFAVIMHAASGRGLSDEMMDGLHEMYMTIVPEPIGVTIRNSILYRVVFFAHHSWFSYRNDLKRRIREVVHEMCKEGGGDNSLVRLMVDEETKERISRREMVETVMSFLVAGQVTSSLAVCWTLYFLGKNGEWQRRVREEVEGWGEGGLEALDGLPVLESVVRESLRLYPPIFFTTRKTKEEVVLDGVRLPKNVTVRIPVLAIHRSEDVWGDADVFRPDRWDEELKLKTRMLWCPFAFGVRGCVGQRFALLEIKAFVAMAVGRYCVSVVAEPRCAAGVFATPKGLKLRFDRLQGNSGS